MTADPKMIRTLYDTLEVAIELSATVQSLKFKDNLPFIFQTTPGFPRPDITQSTALQQADDFILITETLSKCHIALIQARKELTLIGVQYLAKEEPV